MSECNTFLFNGRPLHWKKLELTGDRLLARSSHSATLNGDVLVVFGGFGGSQERYDLCHIHKDTLKCTLVTPQQSSPPATDQSAVTAPRVGHSAAALANHIYIFGGWSGTEYINSGMLYNVNTMQLILEATKGRTLPPARRDHACVTVRDSMYIIGGWNCIDQFNDVWILKPTWEWSCVNVTGDQPMPRRGHSASAIGNFIYVFGGIYGLTKYLSDLYVLDTTTNMWTELPMQGDIPSPRAWHTSNTVGKFIFVFGGTAGRTHFYNDVHVLDTETLQWHQIATFGAIPDERASHSATLVNNQIIIFGGITPSVLENNIYPLENAFALSVDVALVESAGFDHRNIHIPVKPTAAATPSSSTSPSVPVTPIATIAEE